MRLGQSALAAGVEASMAKQREELAVHYGVRYLVIRNYGFEMNQFGIGGNWPLV